MIEPPSSLLDRAVDAIEWYRTTGLVSPASTTGTGAVRVLEGLMSERLGASACFAVASCSTALLLSLQACGVGPGDEVVVAETDWHAGSLAARTLGATAVQASVGPRDGRACLEDFVRALTKRTKAVIVTHADDDAGSPPVGDLVEELRPVDISVIEDAARVFPGRPDCADRRPAGAIGRYGCFSFGTGKAVDTGEGGLWAIRDDSDLERAARLALHPVRQQLFGIEDPTESLNARMNPLAAVMVLHALTIPRDVGP